MAPARLTSVITSASSRPIRRSTVSAASALSHSMTSKWLSSRSRAIISRCIGSSSTTNALARNGFDCPTSASRAKKCAPITGVKNPGHWMVRFQFGKSDGTRPFAGPCLFPEQSGVEGMTAINGSAAAVTGAASGIGRALALELAARGCDLAIADRDEAGLAATAADPASRGRKVTTHRVDVSEPAQIQEFANAATAAHPKLNILINNAGVALLGRFGDIPRGNFEWRLKTNFWGG